MSSSLSQIEYWREPPKPAAKNSNSSAESGKKPSEAGPGAIYLSYDIFMGLSILGGALALDHLYLRSPLTFIAKIIVNILTFGTWWLYDAAQAVFNKDIVRVFGLGVPGMGPTGIAAGVLASDTPDKKHMAFFVYALALLIGGVLGLDSFILGDKQTGFIRLICLISGILTPVAILWWLYNLGVFFFNTKGVINQYWQYFGAQEPAEHSMTFTEKLLTKFPFLQKIFGPVQKVTKAVVTTAENFGEGVIDFAETAAENPQVLIDKPAEIVSSIATGPLQKVSTKVTEVAGQVTGQLKPAINAAIKPALNSIQPAVNAAIAPVTQAAQTAIAPVVAAAEPFKETVDTGLSVAQTGLTTAQEGIALGKTALNTGSKLAEKTLNVIDDTAKAGAAALSVVPTAEALSKSVTKASAQAALNQLSQTGGANDSGILPYVLVGTLGIIVVSGIILTYRRFRQNERPRKDDSPPEPGILRESDKKEPTQTA